MQRIGVLLGSQILMLIFVGSYAWTRPLTSGDEDSVKRLMYAGYGLSPYKRLPSYEFGLGKRSFEEPASYEDNSAPDFYNVLEKKSPSKLYSFGLGKRNRAYGFGLGKRLEQAWKASTASLTPAYRQERRSKIYSFGLGKRGNSALTSDLTQDDYQEEQGGAADKRSRQFSFGLGKREAEPSTSHAGNPNNAS